MYVNGVGFAVDILIFLLNSADSSICDHNPKIMFKKQKFVLVPPLRSWEKCLFVSSGITEKVSLKKR